MVGAASEAGLRSVAGEPRADQAHFQVEIATIPEILAAMAAWSKAVAA